MTMLKAGWKAAFLCVVVPVAALTGCSTEYHGHDSGIDGVLWLQVASFEDPLSQSLYGSLANEPAAYLDSLGGARWEGASVADLTLEGGGVVLYDLSSTTSTAELSVFTSSGPRSDNPPDEYRGYNGPSAVFTCYGITAQFQQGATSSVDRITFDECPAALVATAPKDAVFASGEVFDG